jgi:hypothetical protein
MDDLRTGMPPLHLICSNGALDLAMINEVMEAGADFSRVDTRSRRTLRPLPRRDGAALPRAGRAAAHGRARAEGGRLGGGEGRGAHVRAGLPVAQHGNPSFDA